MRESLTPYGCKQHSMGELKLMVLLHTTHYTLHITHYTQTITQYMESTRQSKIARLIQKELSEIFLMQAKAMNGVLVSVTSVRVSPDLSIARAYISVFPSERGGEIVKNLTGNMRSIRFELGGRLRHQLRIIPELKFFLDDSLDYLDRIDELLK